MTRTASVRLWAAAFVVACASAYVSPPRPRAAVRRSFADVVHDVYLPENDDDVGVLPENDDDVGVYDDAERDDAGSFTGPRWRVVAAWARWERSGLFDHVAPADLEALRELLAAAAPAASADGAEFLESALEARLEVVEALLTIGADGEACRAAFLSAGYADGADAPLVGDVLRFRELVSRPVGERAGAELALRGDRAIDAWLAIDEYAMSVRRRAAMEASDGRAVLAELATTAVALRRLDPLRRRNVALQAVHVHLPLGELLKEAQKGGFLFRDGPFGSLLDEIEDRSYSTLFPETYAHVRANALRARNVVRDPVAFAAECRAKIAETLAKAEGVHDAFFPAERTALAKPGGDVGCALALPLATLLERRLLVEARVKSPASALRKMLRQKNRGAVRDVIGLRVVVLGPEGSSMMGPGAVDEPSAAALYAVADALRCLGAELRDRFKDYVAYPKASGYRSLHATLVRDDGLCLEAQVRSKQMHWDATFGAASHAKYTVERRDAALAGDVGLPRALPPPAAVEAAELPPPAAVQTVEAAVEAARPALPPAPPALVVRRPARGDADRGRARRVRRGAARRGFRLRRAALPPAR